MCTCAVQVHLAWKPRLVEEDADLGNGDQKVFSSRYRITAGGNFPHSSEAAAASGCILTACSWEKKSKQHFHRSHSILSCAVWAETPHPSHGMVPGKFHPISSWPVWVCLCGIQGVIGRSLNLRWRLEQNWEWVDERRFQSGSPLLQRDLEAESRKAQNQQGGSQVEFRATSEVTLAQWWSRAAASPRPFNCSLL